ncbi:hypothetical protein N431DRAFT_515520 [Stipitochalara longipes BDJ]|nr:hypothetical protein N431DRAFT_515520 [Stipitochalara longipes BDJ]
MPTKYPKQGLLDSELRIKLLETFRDSFLIGTTAKDMNQMEKELLSRLKEVAAEGRHSGSDSIVTLTPAEASLLVHANSVQQSELERLTANLTILRLAVATRRDTIEKYGEILDEYNGKFQELLWVVTTKKFRLYGSYIDKSSHSDTNLAYLQSRCDLFQQNHEYQRLLLNLMQSTNAVTEERYQHLEKFFLKRESEYFRLRLSPNTPISKLPENEGLNTVLGNAKIQREKIYESMKAMATVDIAHQKLRSARDLRLTQTLFEMYHRREPQAAVELLLKTYGSNIGLLPPQFYHITSSPEILAEVKSRNGVQLREEAKEFLKLDRDKVDNMFFLSALRGVDFPGSYGHLEQSDWHVPIREVAYLKVILSKSEEEKDKMMKLWNDASKYASKADAVAHELGRLYNDHVSACKSLAFTNHIFAKICDTEAGWKSISENEKRARVLSKVEWLLHDRDRSTNEQRRNEQKLAVKDDTKDRIIREHEDEIALRERSSVSEKKYKEDFAKAQEKYELEHRMRINQEHEIEDKWSIKIQKRNGKISCLEAEIEALKQELKLCQQSTSITPADPKKTTLSYTDVVKENASLRKESISVKKKLDSAKKHLEDGSTKYKTLKTDKEVLEANLNDQSEASNLQKAILSLRSSEEVVKDCIKKAVEQKSQEKDTEIAALNEEIEELRRQRLVDITLIGDLNRDIHEMSKKDTGSGDSK